MKSHAQPTILVGDYELNALRVPLVQFESKSSARRIDPDNESVQTCRGGGTPASSSWGT